MREADPVGEPEATDENYEVGEASTKRGSGKAWLVVAAFAVMAGLLWFFALGPGKNLQVGDSEAGAAESPSTSAPAPTPTQIPLPEGTTDCGDGVAVRGDLACEFGAAAKVALVEVGAMTTTNGELVDAPGVVDPVRGMEVDLVCRVNAWISCGLSEGTAIFVLKE